MITDIDAAKDALKLKVAWDQTPELTEDDLEDILNNNIVGTVWAASTTYKVNSVVIPTENNRVGMRFKCLQFGVSGDTEPTWPTNNCFLGSIVIDNEVVWQVAGMEIDLWDISEAASDAWIKKAGLAADLISLSRGNNSYNYADIQQKCLAMAEKEGGVFIK